MDDKLSIRVNLAERYYPLKIDRGDEEKIRRAARMINEKVLQYKQKYADKDTQDFMAMAALQFVIKVIESEEGNDVTTFEGKVNEVVNELKDYLAKE
jgi:cell division protein ZapA (FtsZ GTPase activity inhibitor)